MGLIIEGKCGCGYHIDNINTGFSGITGKEYEDFPFYCENCDTLIVQNLLMPELVCPNCKGKKLISYDDEKVCNNESEVLRTVDMMSTFGREFVMKNDNNLCPRCKKSTLKFDYIGFWD